MGRERNLSTSTQTAKDNTKYQEDAESQDELEESDLPHMRFICAECGNLFSSRRTWEQHMFTQHQQRGVTDSDHEEEGVVNLPQNQIQDVPDANVGKEPVAIRSAVADKSRPPSVNTKTAPQRGKRERRRPKGLGQVKQQSETPGRKLDKVKLPPAFVTCGTCGQNFYSKRTLQLHVRDAHDKRGTTDHLLVTPLCDSASSSDTRSVTDVEVLAKDVNALSVSQQKSKTLKGVVSYVTCTLCNSNFYTPTTLRHHMSSAHQKLSMQKPRLDTESSGSAKEFSIAKTDSAHNHPAGPAPKKDASARHTSRVQHRTVAAPTA